MLGEGAGVDDLAADILGSEGLELVRGDHEVRERVEGEGAVVVPVHGARVQGQRGQVRLARDRLGEVAGDVAGLGEVDRVAAHLGHDVLPEDDDLLCAELDPGGVGEQLAARHELHQVLGNVPRQWRPREDVGRAGVRGPGFALTSRN